jgi:quercetin dioxygenase-like cupin family protein
MERGDRAHTPSLGRSGLYLDRWLHESQMNLKHDRRRLCVTILRMEAAADTTVKKVEAASSPKGEMGQRYLVAGKRVSMRLWRDEPGGKLKEPTRRDYETVGYVISGYARLELEGQTLDLKPGDSWLVPAGAAHQ